MDEFQISDLKVGEPDATGEAVVDIQTVLNGLFAVYYTETRVRIQFSDNQELGQDQRTALGPISDKRSKIDALLSELRESGDAGLQERAMVRSRELGSALAQCLRGETAQAEASVDRLLQKLERGRAARARMRYTTTAGWASLIIIALILVLGALPIYNIGNADQQTVWFAGVCGVIGALLSVAIAVRDRSLDTDQTSFDMALNAALRMFMGALGGALLLIIIQSGAFGLTLGSADFSVKPDDETLLSLPEGWRRIALIGILGGFFERMVPNLLNRASVRNERSDRPAKPMGGLAIASGTEHDPLGRKDDSIQTANAAPDGSDEVELENEDETTDSCGDSDRAAAADTDDVELPEAIGGVEVIEPSPIVAEEKP